MIPYTNRILFSSLKNFSDAFESIDIDPHRTLGQLDIHLLDLGVELILDQEKKMKFWLRTPNYRSTDILRKKYQSIDVS